MGICLATAFVQDSGDQSSEAAGELVSGRTDATDRADLWATFVERDAGVKAAALLRPAIRRAVDNLILICNLCIYFYLLATMMFW
mmetsp:Transcript_26877/g.41356  ORF Transcript_26877/g.41356 Transcript_26877/m.41356 type:complete len:85 (+) Transcript_26877:1381-1635(+)